MTENKLRGKLRKRFGKRKYRITKEGDVHVYGEMPNTNNIVGWYFFGYLCDILKGRDNDIDQW